MYLRISRFNLPIVLSSDVLVITIAFAVRVLLLNKTHTTL